MLSLSKRFSIGSRLRSGIHSGFVGGIIHIAPEVRQALTNNQAVVALESTIISHGMPYPRNIQVARDVEAVIRKWGAIPATCAIIEGQTLLLYCIIIKFSSYCYFWYY
jgi:hypothetical protein